MKLNIINKDENDFLKQHEIILVFHIFNLLY